MRIIFIKLRRFAVMPAECFDAQVQVKERVLNSVARAAAPRALVLIDTEMLGTGTAGCMDRFFYDDAAFIEIFGDLCRNAELIHRTVNSFIGIRI